MRKRLIPLVAAVASLYAASAYAGDSAQSCQLNYERCRAMCNGSYSTGSCLGGCQSRYSQCLGGAVDNDAHFSVYSGITSDGTNNRALYRH